MDCQCARCRHIRTCPRCQRSVEEFLVLKTLAISLIDDGRTFHHQAFPFDVQALIQAEKDEKEWQCPKCTFSNRCPILQCQMCSTERPSNPEDLSDTQLFLGWKCIVCDSINSGYDFECFKCKCVGSWSVESASPQQLDKTEEKGENDEMVEETLSTNLDSNGESFDQEAYSKCCRCGHMNKNWEPACATCKFGSWNQEYPKSVVGSVGENGKEDEKTQLVNLPAFDNSPMSSDIPDNERRIVLLGRTGEGKSETGNTILDSKVFVSSASSTSVTAICQRGRSTRFGRDIQVIDTPGMFDTEMPIADITREVIRCVGMTAPGPHAFVLVIQIGRYTEEVQNTVDHYLNIFGEDMKRYLIVLFTKEDDLMYAGKTIEEYLRDSAKLQALVQSCMNRYVALNNRGTQEQKDKAVEKLLGMIDEMILKNNGVYTTEIFKEAEKIMIAKENRIRQEHERQIERQRNAIKEQYEDRMKDVVQNYEEITTQLHTQLQSLEERNESDSIVRLQNEMRDLKTQHNRELKKLKETSALEIERVKRIQINARERARQEESSFMKDFLEVGVEALPYILKIGSSLLEMIL